MRLKRPGCFFLNYAEMTSSPMMLSEFVKNLIMSKRGLKY
jgi:hypothetical protein